MDGIKPYPQDHRPQMKDELLITPGEAKVRVGMNADVILYHNDKRIDFGDAIYHPDNVANATLYAEAHNVYNETKLSPRQMVERIKALELDRDNLRAFIENIIKSECWNRVEYLDGGDVQDEAVRMGILGQVPHVLPCSEEFCGCEGEEVDHLYQFTWK